MGYYYETRGDKANAITHYTKALSIKEVPDLKKKVEELKAHLNK